MEDNYYDCMHRVYRIIKDTKDISFIINQRIYKIEQGKLYLYDSYNWMLKPLTSMNFEKLKTFEIELKKVLEIE